MLAIVSSPRIASRNRGMALAENMIASVDSRLAGKTFAAAGSLFSNYMGGYPSFTGTRNASAWCADLSDITCISPWGSYEQNLRIVTLLAPDIGISANHINIAVGSSCQFINMAGASVSLTIGAKQRIGSTDIDIFKFTTSAPGTISKAKVLSATQFADLDRVIAAGLKVPVLFSDQEAKALVKDIKPEDRNQALVHAYFYQPTNAQRLAFYEGIGGGDSGHPAFWIYNNQLVIVTTWQSAVPDFTGQGPSVHYYRNEINAAMTTLGSSYQLTEVTN